jgi:CheY-like chemotaxis protein
LIVDAVDDTSARSRVSLAGVPVLVVDDNATNRRILEQMLRGWDMEPTLAVDGLDALDAMARMHESGQAFRLVITDVEMPRLDGFELVEHIRARPDLDTVPIMMVSSAQRRQEIERCRSLGIEAFLTKPVRQSQLRRAIVSALGTSSDAPELSSATPPRPRPTPQSRRVLRVLVAEDNPVNQKLASSLLRREGHVVVIAENGQQAVEQAEQGQFDVILMDVQMPVLGGLEATAKIRERERSGESHIPIIALTAHAMDGDRESCLAAGMDGYLSKPMRADQLFAAIDAVVDNVSRESIVDSFAPVGSNGNRNAASREEVLDYDGLVLSLGGDHELARSLVTVLVSDASQRLATIRAGVATCDSAAVEGAAHTLKGAAATVMASRVADLARQIETAGNTGSWADASPLVRQLERALEELRAAADKTQPQP